MPSQIVRQAVFTLTCFISLVTVSVSVAQATVVKLDIAFGDVSTDEIFIDLLDTDTPITVANFLSYIENGAGERRIDGTFFHRSATGFVVQGGGFFYDPNDASADGNGFVSVVTDAPIVNEFDSSRSNVRGTLAMAKLGGDPDSATSQWFFNLADNSANLDNQNGGFTVFANVSGDGMQVVDEMALLDTVNLGGAFTALPATDDGAIDNTNLLQITRADVYVPPQAATISAPNATPLDFGLVSAVIELQVEIPLSNIGIDPLTITATSLVGSGAANFSVSNNCDTLVFAERCVATLTYAFVAPADTTSLALEVLSTDPNTPQLLLPVMVVLPSDADGIPDSVEIAGPNGGDANEDGVADALQDHVAAFLDVNGQYVVLEVDPAFTLVNVQARQNPSPTDTPTAATGSLSFDQGFYSFSIEGLSVGGVATATLTLAGGDTPTTYFNFGRLPGEQIPEHWYQFSFDGETGAQFSGNQITLQFTDGGRGDNDQTADGRIDSLGGPPAAFLTVVRFELAFGDQSTEEIYVELFETEAPITVANFLNYVENGDGDRRYDGTFIQESGGFVRGGGYRFDAVLGAIEIERDPSIINEFSAARSNLRGTIGAAKNSDNPPVATSEWFVNLGDNSGFDLLGNGFTVFGRVVGNGLLVVDQIPVLPAENIDPDPSDGDNSLSTVPVINRIEQVSASTLITITRVELYSVPQNAVLSVSEVGVLDFGDIGPGGERQLEISIANLGKNPLNIQSVEFTGADAARASSTSSCSLLEFGENCTETLTLPFGSSAPITDLTLEILSNDPDNSQQLVPVAVTISSDNDNIIDAVEAAGPNGGDANNDGIADVLQNNVTSFPTINGDYVVLETDIGVLRDVSVTDNPSFDPLPTSGAGSLSFDHGFFAFVIENVPVDEVVTVTITLPEGQVAGSNYFKYGRLPQSAVDFWYLFDFDGTIGTQIEGNKITLHLIDGGIGDSDQSVNGRIVDPGGPALLTVPGSAGGGGGCAVAYTVRDGHSLYAIDLVVLLFGVILLMVVRSYRVSKFYIRD